ncbi:MAG: TetR/AcrR family transcriptional regulator [Bacteroidetes bacterium QH_10_64_19]|nr:MAG: TetR/AcrR family transcriptional regulator [Bacteroidetes bacterium QH_10_64_19]
MPSSTDSSLSRRERERHRRRQAMLQAAQSVFAEQGYTQATLDEIAERAEFGKGTLYNYFEDGKEELLFATFDEVYDDLHEMIRSTFEQVDPPSHSFRQAFHELVVQSFAYYEEREELFLILIREAHRLCFSTDVNKAAYFQEQQQRMIDTLAPAVEAAVEEGRIASLPPQSLAHMLLEVVHDLVVRRCLTERSAGLDEMPVCAPGAPLLRDPEAAADFLTALLFDGLEQNSPSSSTS